MNTLSDAEVNVALPREPPAGVDSSASSASRALVGRQPILDRALDVMGYELLFRPSAEEVPAPFDGNRATAQVIINTVTEIGLENILGKHRAFINFTDELLIDGTARLLPPNQVVLEVLEDAVVNDGLVESLTQIVDAGYELALDDFVYSPQWDRLMAFASIIKIDVKALEKWTPDLGQCLK